VKRALFDTDTLSEVIKGRDDNIADAAAAYLQEHRRFTFSVITRYEILRGLEARGATRQRSTFEAQCLVSEVLPLTDEIVVRAAEVYGSLYRAGRLIGDADILIAATALIHGIPVVTNNIDHFERIPGLTVETWRAPRP
jgi:tRNA(fMet)-specific endonuclease VapC